jgi:L-ascorbate metabolism protein UlaG (beta-lactamase superfamily)
MSPPIEWFGCATFRITLRDRVLFFDTYVDRPPGMEPVGLRAADVERADAVFVSHAHFDHMLGADGIALQTGAMVVGSREVGHVLRNNGVPAGQILSVSGGEPVDCGNDIRVRVLPSLHSCLFAPGSPDSGATCIGDLALSAQERQRRVDSAFDIMPMAVPQYTEWFAAGAPHCSRHDGGQLAYLLESPDGSVLVSASSGYWSGLMSGLRPDVAILALAGRPNIDGEPHQGSLATFLRDQVELLRSPRVVLCHHDALLPPVIGPTDTEEALALLRRDTTYASHLDLTYADARPLFA